LLLLTKKEVADMRKEASLKAMKLEMNANGNPFIVYPTVIWDDEFAILIDTGIPGQLNIIREQLEVHYFTFDHLSHIIITHQDGDHLGSLPELTAASGGRLQVMAHELSIPYIQGEIPLLKSGKTVPYTHVDKQLKDGDILPLCGGIQVISTPGHTPDHISLYHLPSKTLIAGDALIAHEGRLLPPSGQFTVDMKSALESVGKLAHLVIEAVICFHGGICTDNIREQLTEITNGVEN
jgi:glyoxylase-like metal-dependent hydrolase (beta-lactamase superfamily II)